jgi:DNA-binding NarL/FixJ family response regulator
MDAVGQAGESRGRPDAGSPDAVIGDPEQQDPLDVVAAVADGPALVEAVAQHRPHVAVVDVRMPPTHTDEGLRAAIALRADHPGVGILVFSQYVETRYASQLLSGSSGGVGYLLKDRVADVGEFVEAVARVAAGGTALDPEVVSQLLAASGRVGTIDTFLTARESEVLALMAEGRSNAAIAPACWWSAREPWKSTWPTSS